MTGEYQRHVEAANELLDECFKSGSVDRQASLAARAQVHATLALAEQQRGQNVLGLMAQSHTPTDMTGMGFEQGKALMEWYGAQSLEVADIADVPPIDWPKPGPAHAMWLVRSGHTLQGYDYEYGCEACKWEFTIHRVQDDHREAAATAQVAFDHYHAERRAYGRGN